MTNPMEDWARKKAKKIVLFWWDGEVGDEPMIIKDFARALKKARAQGKKEGREEVLEEVRLFISPRRIAQQIRGGK